MQSTERRRELDGVRGMALLMIMMWHYVVVSLQVGGFGGLARYLNFSWSGVTLFFVLSGFLIGGILLDNRETSYYFRTFYARRACRILPLYVLILVLFACLLFFGPAFLSGGPYEWLLANPMPFWSYATLLQNMTMTEVGSLGPNWLGVTWSLAVEEQFYLLLPLVVRFFPFRFLPHLFAAAIIAAPLLRATLYSLYPHGAFAAYVLLPCQLDALLLGALCAYGVRKEAVSRFLAQNVRLLYGLAAASALAIFTLLPNLLPAASFDMSFYGYLLFAVLYASVLLIAVFENKGPVKRLMLARPLQELGLIAYGGYLFHQPINGLAHGIILGKPPRIETLTDALVTLLAVVVTISLARASWICFEKPIVEAGRSLDYRSSFSDRERIIG